MIRPTSIATTVFLTLVGCASAGASDGLAGPDRQAGPYLYAPSQDDAVVSVIDTETLEVVATIDLQDLGFSANAKPHHAVVEPDGSHWYLSLIGENRIVKFDRDNQVVAQAEFEVPGMLALHPTEDILFAGRSMSAVNPPTRVGIVDRATMEAEGADVFFPRPHAIALAGGGQWLVTASLALNQMAALDWREEELELVDLEGPIHTVVQFAVSPDGSTMVGTGEMTGQLLVYDVSAPSSPTRKATVEVGQRPWHPLFTPDGRYVFFGNKGSNTVSVIDTSDWSVAKTIRHEALDQPHGSAVSPDGGRVFISSNGSEGGIGSVVVIDVATLSVERVIPLGRNVAGLGTPAAG